MTGRIDATNRTQRRKKSFSPLLSEPRLLRTFTQVESGMHDDVESRPQLRAAVVDAGLGGARLVIAKIDRMVRSIPVMAYLKQGRVQFVACDNPRANELTIDILVAVAADDGRRISRRTKDALTA